MEPKVTGYVTAQTGFINNASNEKIPMASIGLGSQYSNGKFLANA